MAGKLRKNIIVPDTFLSIIAIAPTFTFRFFRWRCAYAMGSTQSTNSTSLSQTASAALGSDLTQRIAELTKGNPNAIAIANTIGNIPVSKDVVDDNLVDFLDQNVTALVDEIRRMTGLSSDQVSSEDIITLLKTARKYGIMAIPYVVGIIATVAGTPVAGAAAGAAAETGVLIASQVEQAIINVASRTKTPEILKKLPSTLAYGKKVMVNILSGLRSKLAIGGEEDVYTLAKKMYGAKMGSCDCEAMSGGADGDVGLMTAREYLKTSSSAAKAELSREIVKIISSIVKESPPDSLPDVEKANWLLGRLTKVKFSENALPSIVDKLCGIINGFVGREIINKSLSNEVKIIQAAEVLHSLTVGMHLEFLIVQGDILVIDGNLQKLVDMVASMSEEIINITQPSMTEGDRMAASAKKDAVRLVNDEIKRQMNMLKAITSGTMSTVDKQVNELLSKEAVDYGHVTDMNNSTHSYMQLVYKLMNMMIITGSVANIFEKATRAVGTTLEDYKNMKTLSELDRLLEKMPKGSDVDGTSKFFEAYELLKKNFERRSTIVDAVKKGSNDDEVYEESDVTKQVNNAKNIRAVQLRSFANRLVGKFKEIGAAIAIAADHVGTGIPGGDKLDRFLLRLDFLREDRTLKGKTYVALSGAVKDVVALSVRGEIIGNYKSLHAVTMELANASTGEGKEALERTAKAIESLIAISDESAEGFKKIIGSDERDGGVDLSGSIMPEIMNVGGLSKSILDLDKIIVKMQAAAKVAKVRENIRNVRSDFGGVTNEYEQLDGRAIAGVINEINEYQSAYLKRLNGADKVFTDFMSSQCDTMRNMWKSAEAIDYLLGNFTHDIRLSTAEISEISSLLEDVTLIRNMYDSDTGDIFTSIFDSFPYDAIGRLPADRVREIGNRTAHYYDFFSADSNAGRPQFGLVNADHASNAIKRSKAFAARFGLIKNIVALFYKLGAKYNREKTTQATKYMPPGSLVRALSDYMHYGSFLVLDQTTTDQINNAVTAVDAIMSTFAANKRTMATFTLPADLQLPEFKSNLSTLNAAIKTAAPGLFQNVYDLISFVKGNFMTNETVSLNSALLILSKTGTAIAAPALYMRSETFDHLRGPPILVRTDEIFVTLFKSMLTKILACVQVFEIAKRPSMYNIYNSAVRQIVGGAGNVDVRDEYIPLYIRLPWLVRFYKNIFSLDKPADADMSEYRNINKSASRLLKISIVPDIDGLYGPLVSFIFKSDRGNQSILTSSQLENIVSLVNKIVDQTSAGSAEEKMKIILNGLKDEVNRRFSIVTKEDVEDYEKMKDADRNRWESLTVGNVSRDDFLGDSVLVGDEDVDTFFSTLPSTGYVSTSSGVNVPGSVLPSSATRVLADKKYYRDYMKLYHNFRTHFERYIIDAEAERESKTLKSSIKGLAKTIAAEPKVSKKLDLLSNFISGTVDINKYDKDRYVAFHEVVIGGMNSLSILDAYVTNIITTGYLVDQENGFGKALIFNSNAAAVTTANVMGIVTGDNSLHLGISRKTVERVMATIERGAAATQLADATGVNKVMTTLVTGLRGGGIALPTFLTNATYVEVLGQHVIEVLYALVNNPLFDVRVTESGINVDYSKALAVAQKMFASVKSSMEKFRPFIDPAFYNLYASILQTPGDNKNTIYQLYDDLFRVKFEGQKFIGADNTTLDSHLGNYYGLDMAISAISRFMKLMKDNQSLASSMGLTVVGLLGNSTPTIRNVDWAFTGSGIERMHVAVDGDKTRMDLRFAARINGLYNWDEAFENNPNVFAAINQVAARFLGRSFDSGSEKVYKSVISAFEKAFPAEISNPYANGWPDIWPAVFKPSTAGGAVRSFVTEKDNAVPAGDVASANVAAMRAGTYAKLTTIDPNTRTILGALPTIRPDHAARVKGYPVEDHFLYASIANIVKNIRGNKNAAGTPLNLAETLSEISPLIKDRMRDEMPIIRDLFHEIQHRAIFLKSIVDNFMRDDNLPVIANLNVTYPAPIPAPSESRMVTYYSHILARLSDIATIFMKTADDICKELQVSLEYGELYPGFLKAYREKHSTSPFIPPSLSFAYMFGNSMNADNGLAAFQPATKKSPARYLTNYSKSMKLASSSYIVDDLVTRFKRSIDGPEALNTEDVRNVIAGIIAVNGMIGDSRAYKSVVARTRMNNDANYAYPDVMNGLSYVNIPATADILTPWALSYFIDNSSAVAPGIVINNVGGYLNSLFITTSPADFLSSIMITDNNEQSSKIFDHFNLAQKMHNHKIDKIDVANILDMNIIPIDFSQFSRFMPLAHLMNYSYTFDRIALDALIPNNDLRKKVYDDIVLNNGFNPTSSEMMLAGLLINPWSKDVTGPNYNHLYVNMMRGVSQLHVGRPKFLSDQVFQKALFGEMFAAGEYDERGSIANNLANNAGTVYPTIGARLFKTIRGAGQSNALMKSTAGWTIAEAHAAAIEKAINDEIAKIFGAGHEPREATVTLIDVNRDNARVIARIEMKDTPHNVRLGGPHRQYVDIIIPGIFYGDQLSSIDVQFDDGAGTGTATVAGGPVMMTISHPRVAASFTDNMGGIAAVNVSTAGDIVGPAIGAILPIAVDVSSDPYSSAGGAGAANRVNNATLVDIAAQRVLNATDMFIRIFTSDRYLIAPGVRVDQLARAIDDIFINNHFSMSRAVDEVIRLLPGGTLRVYPTNHDRLGAIADINVADANNILAAVIIACALYTDVTIIEKISADATILGATVDDTKNRIVAKYGKGVFDSVNIGNPPSIADLSKHPLMRYFNSTTPTVNAPGGANSLRYVDPKRDGYDRVVGVSVASKTILRGIGYARNNTILTRLVIFMMNAYRVILYRLREDAKMRTGDIASRPEEILDDGLVEFSGFDMME